MKIKFLLLAFTLIFGFSGLEAQYTKSTETDSKKSEIGVSYTNNGIGLDYRKHWKKNKFFRISNARVGFGGRFDQGLYKFSTSANFGIENRKSISKKLWLSYGPEAGFKFDGFLGPRTTSNTQVSFGYFIGLNYNLTENLSIGAEIKPYVYGQYTRIPQVGGGLRTISSAGVSSAGKINLSYRF